MINNLLEIANEAANIARREATSFSRLPQVYKTDRDYSTAADVGIETAVKDFLSRETPEIGFMGEETQTSAAGSYWCLDPIDGTINFSRQLPTYAFSLAYVEDDQPIVGVIDLPMLDERYAAVSGSGAELNGQKIRCNDADQLSAAVVSLGDFATGDQAQARNVPRLRVYSALSAVALRLRMFGSAAADLAYLAAGRTDAVALVSTHPWDVAAGVVIAREAGATVIDATGNKYTASSTSLISASADLAPEFFEICLANL
jgi:myo-inositol-1(or 4)-monophosphatase